MNPFLRSLCLLLAAVSLVRAGWTPLENFDALPVGESPAGKDGWSVRADGDSSALVVEDPEGRLGHVLELRGPADSGQFLMLAKTAPGIAKPPNPPVGTVFFRFRLAGERGSEEMKIGVSHVDPERAVAAGALSLTQYAWVRGGGTGEKPCLCAADGSVVDPAVSFQPDIWYEAWLVVDNSSKADTKLFVRSADDPGFSELREIAAPFVATPVPLPLATFCLLKQGQRAVYLDGIAVFPDAAAPGEEPQ